MHVAIIILAGSISFLLTPVAARLAAHFGFMDHPDPRKVHLEPTPLLGGLAMYLAAVVSILIFLSDVIGASPESWRQALSILAGATLLILVGVLDDRGLLNSQTKLVVAMPAAALVLALAGVRVNIWPLELSVDQFPGLYLLASYVLTIVWVVGFTAAYNIFDYMDGLSSGIGALAAAFFLYFAGLQGQFLVGALSAAVLGACLGFLFWNFNPARIFMGDAGAMFLGFMLAAIALKLEIHTVRPSLAWSVPLFVLAVPLFDATLVVISRMRRGLNPFKTPGKDHTAHRLVILGLSKRGAVGMMYMAAAVFGGIAILLQECSYQEHIVVSILLFIALAVLLILLEKVTQPDATNEPGTANQSRSPLV